MTNDHSTFYANFFKAWQKGYGSKPTALMFEQVHGLGCRPGKQALAAAMGLRPEGVTNAQVLLACGNPQNNKRGGLVADGYLKRDMVPNSPEGHTVYKYTVTPKGLKRIEGFIAREKALEAAGKAADAAEPAKAAKVKAAAKPAKKAAKAKKAKAEPKVTTIPGTVEPVNEPIHTDSATAAVAAELAGEQPAV